MWSPSDAIPFQEYYHFHHHHYYYYYYYNNNSNLGGHVNAICDGQSGTVTGFSLCASVFPAAVIPSSLRTHLFFSDPRHVVLVIDSFAE